MGGTAASIFGRMPPSTVRPVRLGVLDESELVTHGLAGMLRPHVARLSVRPLRSSAGHVPDTTGLDVVLCDPFAGQDVQERLARLPALAPAKVLVYTWHDHPHRRRRALDAGADGFLAKDAPGQDLVAAIDGVLRGDRLSQPAGTAGEQDHDFPGLSQRESEVLVLIGRGLSNQEIAERLYVSVNSVKTYVRQVYAKTGVTRRTQAVAWAHEHGWTE